MKDLILTLDYELYGNGSGNVFTHIIDPTNALLKVAEQYDVHFTFFFEVIEYWKLKEEWERGNHMGYDYNPAKAMEAQMQIAYRKGHDVQLHLHPQWVDAYFENGQWKVNNDDWKLGTYNKEGDFSLIKLLQKGKETLENIIRPVDKNYQCIALRAGGYNIQPSFNLVNVMKQVGLFIDSSIYPGGKETGSLSVYDYTNISVEKECWRVDNELETEGNSTIMEFPIVAFPILRLSKYFSTDRIKSFLQNKKSAKDTFESKTGGKKSTLYRKIKFLFDSECQTWDFCLFPVFMHKKFLKKVREQNRKIAVLVGHPKSYVSSNGLKFLLEQTKGEFVYPTIIDVYNKNLI